jgi:hypothetical protein
VLLVLRPFNPFSGAAFPLSAQQKHTLPIEDMVDIRLLVMRRYRPANPVTEAISMMPPCCKDRAPGEPVNRSTDKSAKPQPGTMQAAQPRPETERRVVDQMT